MHWQARAILLSLELPATVSIERHDRQSRFASCSGPHGARCAGRQLGRPAGAGDVAALSAAGALRPADRGVAAALSVLVGADAGGTLHRPRLSQPLVPGAVLRRRLPDA